MTFRVGRRPGYMIPSPATNKDPRKTRGGNMYARMTTLAFHIEKYDEGVRVFDQSIVPAAKAQKGFKAIYLLADRQGGRCVAVTFWEDEAAATANEQNLYYVEQLVKLQPFFASPPVREGYEIVIEAH